MLRSDLPFQRWNACVAKRIGRTDLQVHVGVDEAVGALLRHRMSPLVHSACQVLHAALLSRDGHTPRIIWSPSRLRLHLSRIAIGMIRRLRPAL